MRPAPTRRRGPVRRSARTWALAAAAVVVLVAAAPDPIPLGGARLWALTAIVAGAAVTVARTRAVDLAFGPTVGVATVAGAIVPALLGVPAAAGLPLGAAAGAIVGGLAGGVVGRVGRQLGALATLALGGALVAVLAALELTGGVVGFHAVGLPTAAGERADALLVGAVAVAVLLVAHRVAGSVTAAAAAVAAADPAVARSHGRSPALDAASIGATGGALAGVGGTLLAMVDGSVVPAAYGLELTATVVAAAAVGGAGPLGPVLGALLVWGPATLFPLTPLGAAPVLITAGPLVLVVLALRRGRPLTAPPAPPPPSTAPPPPAPSSAAGPGSPRLRLDGTPTPCGPVDLEVVAGEVVAVVGPNGAGKSTLLARVGGQLSDDRTVAFDGRTAPRGARRRARAGLARTWQRAPDVAVTDLDRLHPVEADGGELARTVARRPRIALLDEPTASDPGEVAAALAALRADGAAVLIVDHRPEVVAAADRTIALSPSAPAPTRDGHDEQEGPT